MSINVLRDFEKIEEAIFLNDLNLNSRTSILKSTITVLLLIF